MGTCITPGAHPDALDGEGLDEGVKGRLKRERIYVYLRLIHIVIWQKPIQYYKAIILQLQTNFKKKNKMNISKPLEQSPTQLKC